MFHRRSFLVAIGGAALAAPAMASNLGSSDTVAPALIPSYIANLADHGARDGLLMSPGQVLDLRREPDRVFDASSIAVLLDDRRLGYLPANQSRTLAPLIDAGFTVSATLVALKTQPRLEARLNLAFAHS